VLQLRAANHLTLRTIHQVFHTTRAMFRDAVADEVIENTPCVIRKGILPKKTDKDPSWRHTVIYTREELERMISDARIPHDRRVLYGLKGLAGLRHGEAATLTWRQYDDTLEPLGGLLLETTKTKVPRRVPLHPTLARLLQDWKTTGFEATVGRAPTPEDFVVPTRNLTMRPSPDAQRALRIDLKLLGFRLRRGHYLRRTFITLAQVDGARAAISSSQSRTDRAATSSACTRPSPGRVSAPRWRS
jgi:integrase